MRVLFPGIEDHPVLRELEVTRLCSASPRSPEPSGKPAGSPAAPLWLHTRAYWMPWGQQAEPRVHFNSEPGVLSPPTSPGSFRFLLRGVGLFLFYGGLYCSRAAAEQGRAVTVCSKVLLSRLEVQGMAECPEHRARSIPLLFPRVSTGGQGECPGLTASGQALPSLWFSHQDV